jgi:hypothetical protein
MVRKLLIFSFLFISASSFADISNTVKNVTSCLSNQPSGGGTKGQCVQAQIKAESDNQVANVFKVYADITNKGLGYYQAKTGVPTPNTPGGGSGGSSAASANVFTSGNKRGAQASPPPVIIGSPPQSPGATTTTTPPPKQQGGIQYY